MSAILVDSNVLLDVMSRDAEWFGWSSGAISRAAEHHRLVINPVIYGEISIGFAKIEELDEAVPREIFDREPLPFEAAFLAGKCFVEYRRRGGNRKAPLPDFFIGAHAALAGYQLLTRDTRRYRSYFPKLRVIAPD